MVISSEKTNFLFNEIEYVSGKKCSRLEQKKKIASFPKLNIEILFYKKRNWNKKRFSTILTKSNGVAFSLLFSIVTTTPEVCEPYTGTTTYKDIEDNHVFF